MKVLPAWLVDALTHPEHLVLVRLLVGYISIAIPLVGLVASPVATVLFIWVAALLARAAILRVNLENCNNLVFGSFRRLSVDDQMVTFA